MDSMLFEKLREKALVIYDKISENDALRPAAFGVACRFIMDEANCNLATAVLLLKHWTERRAKH